MPARLRVGLRGRRRDAAHRPAAGSQDVGLGRPTRRAGRRFARRGAVARRAGCGRRRRRRGRGLPDDRSLRRRRGARRRAAQAAHGGSPAHGPAAVRGGPGPPPGGRRAPGQPQPRGGRRVRRRAAAATSRAGLRRRRRRRGPAGLPGLRGPAGAARCTAVVADGATPPEGDRARPRRAVQAPVRGARRGRRRAGLRLSPGGPVGSGDARARPPAAAPRATCSSPRCT